MSFKNYKNALHDLFEEQKNCDVTFSCSDPTTRNGKSTIMAHKFVLSLSSDVFDTMFNGEAAKQENVKNKRKPISIDDIQMPAFKMLLSYIYTKSVDFESLAIASDFYYAAHKYNVKDALEYIKTYMLDELNLKNAIFLFEIACMYEDQEVKRACVKIFSENTMAILNSQIFLKASPTTIESIFKLNALNISSEVELIKALERYIDHNKAQDPDIVEKVLPALGHIRFLALSASVIAKTSLLNPEDALQVIGCLSSEAAASEMPTFLSSNNQKRAYTISAMEMIRKLSPVYSDRYCNHCTSFNRASNHAFWNCTTGSCSQEHRAKVKEIYLKYNHVWLLDYDLDDLRIIYKTYKSLGNLKQETKFPF